MADLRKAYRTIMGDNFPEHMRISFGNGDLTLYTLYFEKMGWDVGGKVQGLRYGENPGQEAALYRLVNGNLEFAETTVLQPGRWLVSDIELLQSGKHPGKTNITDADNALNIMRYLMDEPTAIIVKHNNPCGVAQRETLADAYFEANMADRVAAFGGCIALNRPLDKDTAEMIAESYSEVVVAPEFEEGAFDIIAQRKNLRIVKIGDITKLRDFCGQRVLDFKSLMDFGQIVQWSYVPDVIHDPIFPLASFTDKEGVYHTVNRGPSQQEYNDMMFGWLVEAGVTSNSVIYVKDRVTVGIGTGEQDRVGVAKIARDKAYDKLADRLCFMEYGVALNDVTDREIQEAIASEVQKINGGLKNSVMVSDAFFPFKDGVEVGLNEGVSAVIQPGGSNNDLEVIEACNRFNATMCFTGQRSFKH